MSAARARRPRAATPARPRGGAAGARPGGDRRRAARAPDTAPVVRVRPATTARWADLERLFGAHGACAGCWCMWPRVTSREFAAGKGAPHRRALKRLVDSGRPPGLIAYAGREPIGWVAMAPRSEYRRLATSRVMAAVDDTPVWAVVCFFVARAWRRRGVTAELLAAAKSFAASRGAVALEGYPFDPHGAAMADAFAWHGLASAFASAGFAEVARRSPTRPVMRCTLARPRAASSRGARGAVAGGAGPAPPAPTARHARAARPERG